MAARTRNGRCPELRWGLARDGHLDQEVAVPCQNLRVPLIEYFTASTDADAARVLPGSGGPAALGFDTVPAKGIDPAVVLGNLESIVTGRPYDEVMAASRQCHLLTDGEAETLVVTVTDTMRDALATAAAERLRQAAEPWAATDELAGAAPAVLADVLTQFAALSRRAVDRDHHLYCWWAL